MLTWEHGHKVIFGDIVYIFNEFDLIIDDSEVKLVEYLNDLFHVFSSGKFYNITDGLRNAIREKKLLRFDIYKRLEELRNTKQLKFNDYSKAYERLKAIGIVDLAKCSLFVESTLPRIWNRSLVSVEGENSIITMNDFSGLDIDQYQKEELLKKFIENKTVVIVDTVIPKYFANVLSDCTRELLFIGSTDYYEINKRVFTDRDATKQPEFIGNVSINQYFNEVVNFVDSYSLNDTLVRAIDNIQIEQDKYDFVKSHLQPPAEVNLYSHLSARIISLKVFPYIILKLSQENNNLVNSLFKGFSKIYHEDVLQYLKVWHSLFITHNLECLITSTLVEELRLNDHSTIDLLFDFLDQNKQYVLFKSDQKNYIKEIVENCKDNLREYLSIKIIGHCLKKQKLFSILLKFTNNDLSFIEEVRDYISQVLDDQDTISIEHFPVPLQEILHCFKNEYKLKYSDLDWIHHDGPENTNSILSPTPISLIKSKFYSEEIEEFQEIRPFISKKVIYFIEKGIAKIFDGGTFGFNKYKFPSYEKMASFFAYDSKLIYSLSNGTYLINKNGEELNLNVFVEKKTYKDLRIKNNYVYFFPESTVLLKSTINDFLNGEAAFSEYQFEVPESLDVKDLLIDNEKIYWATNNMLYIFNETTKKNEGISLTNDQPIKLFCHKGTVYLLCKNSIYYLSNSELSWLTDLREWDSFTCYNDLLILAYKREILVVSLLNGNIQIINDLDLPGDISDMIMTGNRLIIVDIKGAIYSGSISENSIKNIDIKFEIICQTNAGRAFISYSNRLLGVNNSSGFYVYTA